MPIRVQIAIVRALIALCVTGALGLAGVAVLAVPACESLPGFVKGAAGLAIATAAGTFGHYTHIALQRLRARN